MLQHKHRCGYSDILIVSSAPNMAIAIIMQASCFRNWSLPIELGTEKTASGGIDAVADTMIKSR